MMLKLSNRQIMLLIQNHNLPQSYRTAIEAALQEAFKIGHNSDVMTVKHKPTKEK